MANLQGITRRNGSNKAAKAESSASARTSKECVDEWMDRARGLGDERANARRTSLERNRNRSAECRGQLAAAAVDIAYRGGVHPGPYPFLFAFRRATRGRGGGGGGVGLEQ